MDATAVVHFRSFRAPVAEVWPYLSRPELLGRWLGEADLELAAGGAASLRLWNGDQASGQLLTFSPPIKLEMALKPFDLDHECRVSWRLEGDGPGSRLTVAQDNLRSAEERAAARRTWREALEALKRAADGSATGTGAAEWGATIPVLIRTTIARPAAEVWPMIATSAGLEKWIAHVERFDGTQGGLFRLISRYQGSEVVEEGRIEEIVPDSRLRLTWEWAGQGWGAPTKLELSLEPRGGGTSLLLAHGGFEDIAPEVALAARRNYASAWPGVVRDLRKRLAPVPSGAPTRA